MEEQIAGGYSIQIIPQIVNLSVFHLISKNKSPDSVWLLFFCTLETWLMLSILSLLTVAMLQADQANRITSHLQVYILSVHIVIQYNYAYYINTYHMSKTI